MIEWIKYESAVPNRLKLYLVSGGLWVSFGMHQFDGKDRVYRWIAADGEPLDGVTHFAEINYPAK
ncbi:hypothetical protein [Paenibacillus sp. L3-i20]|uniref:hypothetical protein n=1 Tax=Paenibacillus sp. L3-i20 TaxID=2905833 RepID=UPI001EE00C8E|nr:hypothetical protein [Paenibacillus sp. L3-i20]GKU79270.1 hypothetical protein L3i20_v236670 [Paenibacillus sp. L3-i20]